MPSQSVVVNSKVVTSVVISNILLWYVDLDKICANQSKCLGSGGEICMFDVGPSGHCTHAHIDAEKVITRRNLLMRDVSTPGWHGASHFRTRARRDQELAIMISVDSWVASQV